MIACTAGNAIGSIIHVAMALPGEWGRINDCDHRGRADDRSSSRNLDVASGVSPCSAEVLRVRKASEYTIAVHGIREVLKVHVCKRQIVFYGLYLGRQCPEKEDIALRRVARA